MKIFLLALFVAAVAAAPTTINNDGVELILNGVPEGEPLEISDVVDIKVKEHVDGVLTSKTDLLHPLTAVGLAEAAQVAAEAAAQIVEETAVEEVVPTLVEFVDNVDEVIVPELSVVEPVEEIPVAPIVLPEPAQPEVVPAPVDVIAINPVVVEPVPETVQDPVPIVPAGEVYNDGLVQIHVNAPEEAGMFSTIQNWFSIVVNYISNGIQTTQQIV